MQFYNSMSIKFIDIELEASLLIANNLNIYAYDAYLIACAIENHCPLISLDNGLIQAAKSVGASTMEIKS